MKINKIIRSVLAVAAVAVMFSGCFPTGEVSVPDTESVPPEKVEGIVVRAELPAHTPESVPEITMRLCEFDRG